MSWKDFSRAKGRTGAGLTTVFSYRVCLLNTEGVRRQMGQAAAQVTQIPPLGCRARGWHGRLTPLPVLALLRRCSWAVPKGWISPCRTAWDERSCWRRKKSKKEHEIPGARKTGGARREAEIRWSETLYIHNTWTSCPWGDGQLFLFLQGWLPEL